MAPRRIKLIAASSALVLGAGGYFLYSVFAVQGQGELAQAPLNVQTQVPPAFIMAVDDSGSMRFQTLFPARDGTALWGRDGSTTSPGNIYSFFHTTGTYANRLRGSDPNTPGREFVHVAPYPAPRQADPGNDNAAIPPIDAFGFSRSPTYNPAYFNPDIEYKPWRKAIADALGDYWPVPNPAATPIDPNNPTGNTVNLTAVTTSTSNNNATHHGFRIRNGMVLPAGMKYYGAPGCRLVNANSTASTPAGWRTLNAEVTANCDVTAYIAFYPATVYLPTAHAGLTGFIAANAPTITNACSYQGATGANRCDLKRYDIIEGNFTYKADYDKAIKNFATWFSYYGARNRSMVAAITNSMHDVNNMRVGYFTINNRVNAVMRNMALPAEKAAFYTDIVTLGAAGNTPNLPAVGFLGEQFKRTGDGAPIKLACQKNGGMLFTDGLSNVAGPTVGNVDGAMGVPFQDTHSNTLADIATKYYLDGADGKSPLNTVFEAGQVPVPKACGTTPVDSIAWKRLDCQKNLHMNFYGITLGATGEIFDPNVERDPFTAPPAWLGFESGERSAVDDIWHAAVNTRGEFINARTPAEITAAMRRVLESFSEGSSPSGSISLTGARIGTGSLTVAPFYEARNSGTDWYGKLTAQTPSANPITGVVTFADVWEASNKLPKNAAEAAARNVWFGAADGVAKPFNSTNVGNLANLCNNPIANMSFCSATELAALDSDTPITLSDAIAYLKGDPTKVAEEKLRFRTTPLGDIVNSTPVVSAPTDNYGYSTLPGTLGSSYRTYLTDNIPTGKANRRAMVYVGANDGMLHAFDGRSDTTGGIERFAYIPHAVLGHMGNLLYPLDPTEDDQKFQHRYFVDGPVVVTDAYYGSGWKTVLMATTGAGARGAFMLNVSDAANPSTTNPFSAADRLWEINDTNTALSADVRNNIGYVLGKPVIVPVKTGTGAGPVKWRAIFGNGYNSVSRKAVLFLVDVGAGAPNITMIEATEATAPAGSNGLGNIVVVDRWGPNAADSNKLTARLRDGFADTVYAADQKGAIWKFDLRAADPDDLTTPLFVTKTYTGTGPEAGTRQPILGGLTAAAGPGGGVMVFFGTGSFSFTPDSTDNTSQSLYAVLDNGGTTPLTRTNLHQQTIVSTDGDARDTSTTAMPPGKSGWFLDLGAGERFVGYPRIESGVVFMPTYSPNTAVSCTATGNNWLYGLNALSGAAGLSNVRIGSPTGTSPGAGTGAVKLNTGGTAPVKDVAVMTSPRIKPLGAAATPAELAAALGAQCSMVVQVAGAPPLYLPRACGRQSWRQIQ